MKRNESRNELYLRILTSGPKGKEDYDAVRYLKEKGFTDSPFRISRARDSFNQVLDVVWLGPNANGIDKIEELETKIAQANSNKKVDQLTSRPSNSYEKPMQILDVFISHSSRDESIAERLVTLIRSALNLATDKIRCTSLNGFRLPAGTTTNERLRQEIYDSKAFIALITPNSLESTYVLFELGARWGTQKPMVPLLACGMTPVNLREPLSAINALNCSDAAQLHQFIADLADILEVDPDRPAAYQKHINELIKISEQTASLRPTANNHDIPKPREPVSAQLDAGSSVLFAIWQLDTEKYSENGYRVEEIASKSSKSAPECKHYLESFTKDRKLKRVEVIGNNGGLHYSLTVDGSSFLIGKGLIT